MIRLIPGPTPLRGEGESLDAAGRARLRTAALKARRVYPGHLGLLAARELNALADLGFRFDGDALIPRLAAQILAADLPDVSARGSARYPLLIPGQLIPDHGSTSQ